MNSHIELPEHQWQMLICAAGRYLQPSGPGDAWAAALPVSLPCTAASALQQAQQFSYGEHDFDDCDIWFRCQLNLPPQAGRLEFDGLAGLAEVFWNDRLLFRSENMFISHSIDLVSHAITGEGQLCLRFIALNSVLGQRRARPRWKTRLVSQQQLRWHRQSLLGRMPGWSPPVAPVGPYLPYRITDQNQLQLSQTQLQANLNQHGGLVTLSCIVHSPQALQHAVLQVGAQQQPLACQLQQDGSWLLHGEVCIAEPQLWWPHTHGQPHLYACGLLIETAGQRSQLALDSVGFRHITANQTQQDFHLHVNQQAVFCRGACWMPADPLSLNASPEQQRAMLTLARDAGMNMLRVVGTMAYENPAFYRLCDELGIMVWQDFMFANMDYPVSDPDFAAAIDQEARQFLRRSCHSPSLVVLCGNSEVEQQAAMLGQPAELWSNDFFRQQLPAICQQFRPDCVYWPSSPSGGVMPFQTDAGIAHYFGVGAYLRPLEDARSSGLRFTTECLGFSNMPEDRLLDSLADGNGDAPGPHVSWKQRIPRDHGTGWDFEDVRDHYLQQLYQQDPMRLRYSDRARYIALARCTSGELIERTLREWRRHGSSCHGALIWFWRDLWAGAGWGLIDAEGRPKAAYHYARRALQPLCVSLTDEGLNGLAIHLLNDGPQTFRGRLEFGMWRHGETQVASVSQMLELAPHSSRVIAADALLPHFLDTAYAYRFGPPGHHVSAVHLYPETGQRLLASDFHFPLGQAGCAQWQPELSYQANLQADGSCLLQLHSKRLAQAVSLQADGWLADDNYFHIAPGIAKTLLLTPEPAARQAAISVSALNMQGSLKISPSQSGS